MSVRKFGKITGPVRLAFVFSVFLLVAGVALASPLWLDGSTTTHAAPGGALTQQGISAVMSQGIAAQPDPRCIGSPNDGRRAPSLSHRLANLPDLRNIQMTGVWRERRECGGNDRLGSGPGSGTATQYPAGKRPTPNL